ncbi:MAG TPA: DISARM system helicase DrmA [Verrucomicrobiae bacterium]|nr:DISARM system helicase DrmA [Verrucomicrobiae bacterium]
MADSQAVRAELVEAIKLDLVGPDNDHAFAHELLRDTPSRWYLAGFLVPTDAPIAQKTDATALDELDGADDAGGTEDAVAPEKPAARRSLLPSSMGLSVLVRPGVKDLKAVVQWGDYHYEGADKDAEPADDPACTDSAADSLAEAAEEENKGAPGEGAKPARGYRREPREEVVAVRLPGPGEKPTDFPVPNGAGLVLTVTVRTVSGSSRLPAGTRSVSVFLVNHRTADPERRYRSFAFQTRLIVGCPERFVPRPDLRGSLGDGLTDEWDERLADLQYRDVCEFAVGHGVSAEAHPPSDPCHEVRTAWVPSAEVERVAPAQIPGVELGMEALGALADGAAAQAALAPLVTQYRAWISKQKEGLTGLDDARRETAEELFTHARHAAARIEAGIACLGDPQILGAFRIANRAMAAAARQREAIQRGVPPDQVPGLSWRPFQIAFILMALPGIIDPKHADRDIVDLLFFPTGGGKTEAYLGLAAFTMVLRRLRHPGIRSAGLAVLMRYTLRLLTLDQLGRAAGLMCALELEREKDRAKLGEWPFEIGLWVGSAATPNRMGHQGYDGPGADKTAYRKTNRFAHDTRNPAPIPIENCPWCGEKFSKNSFRLVPNPKRPLDLRVHCANHNCAFSGDRPLPVLGVDEPIYRRLPAFLIATVDKFAALTWTGETGTLFGLVDRHDQQGFYGPCDPGKGTSLGGPLPPPELVIQDELHLISGPLGTIAGVYETAIDALASRKVGETLIRPKIIASTATVRRADSQIRALFERPQVAVFPPPGPDRRDSFFAITEPSSQTPARLYVGVAAQGRSLKVVLLRTSLALLSAAQTAYVREGGRSNKANPADPYMTLLGYFNSLRELGGSRRIIEDEVRTRAAQYGRRRRRDPEDTMFRDRQISYEVLELTSRVSTSEVAVNKRRLAQPFCADDRVDVALATNMISVGLDIIRLGLMVVLGQPKTSAEYIQATSRVGRDPKRPGLVVTLLNVHKPRDRSHYERFDTYHATFYRAVEATSVTPFSPRALDRALAGALVALCRHGHPQMTPPKGANEILALRAALTEFATRFAERAANHSNLMTATAAEELQDKVSHRCVQLLDDWFNIAEHFRQSSALLQYQPHEVGGAKRLLYEPLHPDLETLPPQQRQFRANRSMRDVEPSVDIAIKNLNDWGDKK